MNNHDINVLIGKLKMKVKIIEGALLDKNQVKASGQIARATELLKLLNETIKDK